jgi:DNA-binding CsgD family transcriptional regulator
MVTALGVGRFSWRITGIQTGLKEFCEIRLMIRCAFADLSTESPLRRGTGGFMSSAISSLLSTASVNAASAASSNSANSTVAQSTQTAASSGDTVTLSPSQQVHQLYQQGQAVPQIAVALDLSIETVNSYLNISSAKS